MADPQRAKAAPPASGPSRATRARKAKRTPGQLAMRFFTWFGVLVLALAVLAGAGFGVVYATSSIPDPNKDFQTNTTQIFYRDGQQVMGSFIVQNRVTIPSTQMPQAAKDAIVAAENETFWTDPGISVNGLIRALITAVGPGDTVGGSTLTQQYVKVTYLNQEKTLTRKLREIIIALKVGQDVPKEQILEGYLNTVYYGRGTYGIQAAAKAYFAKDAKDLDLKQSIALVAIINSPGNLDPANGDKHRADLLERYQYTINQMVKMGKLTPEQKAQIYTSLPDFPKLVDDSRFGGNKGYILKMVQDEMKTAGFTEAQINGGGLQVITTVDKAMQDAAVQAAEGAVYKASAEKKKDPKNLHAALASVEIATGGVLALYGGVDFVDNNRNWATTPRPTGSTFKPWALVAALRNGMTLNDTFNGNTYTPKGDTQPVVNGANYGSVTLIKATTSSINSAYVDVVSQINDGPNQVIKAATDAGIPKHASWTPTNRIALGYPEVSPLAAAAAYGTLGNGGKRVTPHVLNEIRDRAGKTIWKATVEQPQAIEPDVAQDATYALTNVAEAGTGRVVSSLGWPVAGKTGTRYDAVSKQTKASWFVGYTKQISTAVMFVVNDDGNGNLDDYSRGFYGSNYPARTWLDYMADAQKGLPKLPFDGPTKRTSNRVQVPAPAPETAIPSTEVIPPDPEETPAPAEPTSEPTSTAPQPTPVPSPTPVVTPPAPPAAPGPKKTP